MEYYLNLEISNKLEIIENLYIDVFKNILGTKKYPVISCVISFLESLFSKYLTNCDVSDVPSLENFGC